MPSHLSQENIDSPKKKKKKLLLDRGANEESEEVNLQVKGRGKGKDTQRLIDKRDSGIGRGGWEKGKGR